MAAAAKSVAGTLANSGASLYQVSTTREARRKTQMNRKRHSTGAASLEVHRRGRRR